jgi:hypothetical protein
MLLTARITHLFSSRVVKRKNSEGRYAVQPLPETKVRHVSPLIHFFCCHCHQRQFCQAHAVLTYCSHIFKEKDPGKTYLILGEKMFLADAQV